MIGPAHGLQGFRDINCALEHVDPELDDCASTNRQILKFISSKNTGSNQFAVRLTYDDRGGKF
jgi:hypothetical protein